MVWGKVIQIIARKTLRPWVFVIVSIVAIGCGNEALTTETVDDHGNSIADATIVNVPSNTTARIEIAGDLDFYSIPLMAGNSYRFETRLGTLQDTNLKLFDQWNHEYGASDDFGGLASRIEFTPTSSLTMYIQVTGNGINTGSYKFNVDTFSLLPVSIERVVRAPMNGEPVDPGNPGLAIFKAEIGSEIALVGTGFSPTLKGNNVWLGDQSLVVTSVGPGFVTVVVDGVVDPDPARLTIGTDLGEDSIDFVVEPLIDSAK